MSPRAVAAMLAVCAAVVCCTAEQLHYVVIVTRHGVRSPTWTTDRLNGYSAEPWPDWGVPPGNLTPHGREGMKQFGAWYRAELIHEGLLHSATCGDAAHVFFRSDKDQRTQESARALAEGLLPNCSVKIDVRTADGRDPLFYGAGRPDHALAAAAVQGRIGQNPRALVEAHEPQLQELQRVLGRKSLPADNSAKVVPGSGENLVGMTGPLGPAATLSENLFLEYVEGMSGSKLAWGRMDQSALRQFLTLHTSYADVMRRAPYVARAHVSNLMAHLLASMEQAISGQPVHGAIGNAHDSVLVISGHDTNLENISGMLGLSWLIEGYVPDDTPPGGALVFELWLQDNPHESLVRTYFTAQTPDQLRRATALTAEAPPGRSDIFIPGCSTAAHGFPCAWKSFQRTVRDAIDPAFTDQ